MPEIPYGAGLAEELCMMPMQPFQVDPRLMPKIRRELPTRVKTVLGLKLLGCLLTIGGSFLVLAAFEDSSRWPEGMTAEMAHRMATLAMMSTGISLLELFGVAGTWSFKRWGVYVLAGFSMLNFVVRMHSGDTFGALLSIGSTAIAGAVVASRWEDFE